MDSETWIWLWTMPVISLLLLAALFAQSSATAPGIDAFRQGRFAEARKMLEQAAAANPSDAAAGAFLAMTKAALHDCAPAALVFTTSPDSTLARMSGLAAVECESAVNRNAEAFALLARLVDRFPADPDVLYCSAKLHRAAWDSTVATLYAKAPASYRVNQLSGEIFETQGKYGEAAAQYGQAIAKAPDALNLHYRRGRCLLLDSTSAANLDKAQAEFESELKLNPSDAFSEYQLGQISSVRRQSDAAVSHYERALQLRPEFPEALIAEGKLHAQDKQYEQATRLFERAAKIQPDNEAAHYNLMLAYRNSGRAADALLQKKELDRLQKPPEGEFTEFLKKLNEKAPAQ